MSSYQFLKSLFNQCNSPTDTVNVDIPTYLWLHPAWCVSADVAIIIKGVTLHRHLYFHPRPGSKWGQAALGGRWAWLMLDSQRSRLDFWSGQGIELKNLMGQDLDPDRGWKYRCLCSRYSRSKRACARGRRAPAQQVVFMSQLLIALPNCNIIIYSYPF